MQPKVCPELLRVLRQRSYSQPPPPLRPSEQRLEGLLNPAFASFGQMSKGTKSLSLWERDTLLSYSPRPALTAPDLRPRTRAV